MVEVWVTVVEVEVTLADLFLTKLHRFVAPNEIVWVLGSAISPQKLSSKESTFSSSESRMETFSGSLSESMRNLVKLKLSIASVVMTMRKTQRSAVKNLARSLITAFIWVHMDTFVVRKHMLFSRRYSQAWYSYNDPLDSPQNKQTACSLFGFAARQKSHQYGPSYNPYCGWRNPFRATVQKPWNDMLFL